VPPPTIVSPEDQRVTFVELFFDLVFSVTQVVALRRHKLIQEVSNSDEHRNRLG
jgi:low temperature requirement protein LtrA